MRRLQATEGDMLGLAPGDRSLAVAALDRLTVRLRPRRPFLGQDGRGSSIHNLVGVVRLSGGTLLEIAPKVPAGADWIGAVLDLLTGDHRVELAGARRGGPAPPRRDLLDALARLYAEQLETALVREGPIVVVERHHETLPLLKGKLAAAAYARHLPLRMHRFPVGFDQLGADNDYNRALVVAARLLAGAADSHQVRARLQRAVTLLRPGLPDVHGLPPAAATRTLPPQWGVYRAAWSIACAVLQRSSLLGRAGNRHALEVAIEPWPLLEQLLTRALRRAEAHAAAAGITARAGGRPRRTLLADPSGPGAARRTVEPDGVLVDGTMTVATFEAKYSRRGGGGDWPRRGHVFQALSTAATFGAPVAVLVYPERFETVTWDVPGFAGRPGRLAAVGLDLYSYRRGPGDDSRGRTLWEAVSAVP